MGVAETGDRSLPELRESYLARHGTVLLVEEYRTDVEELHSRLVAGLQKDNRVAGVEPGTVNAHWTSRNQFYPAFGSPTLDALLSGSDHMHVVRLSHPILFRLSVPTKNQPIVNGEDAEASDYLVAWDGISIIVMWARPSGDDPYIPSAAGQIALEVVEVAARSAGVSTYVQPCSSGCQLKFGHVGMRIDVFEPGNVDGRQLDFGPIAHGGVDVSIWSSASDLELLERVYHSIRMPAMTFAEVKNQARRILQLEAVAFHLTSELIHLDYQALQESQDRLLRRAGYLFRDLWRTAKGTSRTKRARFLTASLWLAMAAIETLQRNHADTLRDFEDAIADHFVADPMFGYDLKSDEAAVQSLTLDFVRSAVEDKSSGFGIRTTAAASIVGALVGGLLTLGGSWLAISASG